MVAVRADYELAQERALELLKRHRITAPPVKVHELAGALGLDVREALFESPYDRNIQGYLDWNERRIVLNASDPITRKRFTLAHEIGHVELHRAELEADPNLGIMYRQRTMFDANPDPREREANHFAANLLMPGPMIDLYSKYGSIEALAAIFLVSKESMRIRLDSLRKGII